MRKTLATFLTLGSIAFGSQTVAETINEKVDNGPSYKDCKIVGVKAPKWNREIFVMDYDGSNKVNLTNTPLGFCEVNPKWSPDGKAILYCTETRRGRSKQPEYAGEVWIMKRDGSGKKNLTNHPAKDYRARWAPDGRISFISERDGGKKLFVMDADGTNVIKLPEVNPLSYSWSPDGKRIAFVSNDKNPKIVLINSDGTNLKHITNNSSDKDLAWSPDGRIAYLSRKDGKEDIYIINSDGTNETQLTNEKGNKQGISLSPDGKYIAFISDKEPWAKDGYMGIGSHKPYIVDVETLEVRKILDVFIGGLIWSPDSEVIMTAFNEDMFLIKADGIGANDIMTAKCYNPEYRKAEDKTGLPEYLDQLVSPANKGVQRFPEMAIQYMSWSPLPIENEKEERITKVADLNGDFEGGVYDHSSGTKMPLQWDGIGGTLHYQNDGSNGYLVLGNPVDTWTVAHTVKPPIPLEELLLDSEHDVAFSADMIKLGEEGRAELKLEQYKNGGETPNGVARKEIAPTDRWATYRADFTIKPDTDSVVFVLVALDKGASYGFDNVRIVPIKKPSLDSLKLYKDCKIAFASKRGENKVASDIYVMNPDGSGLENLTDNGLRNVGPSWSPDGKKIGFSSYREGDGGVNWDIYIMNPDGSDSKRVTSRLGRDYMGSWSPDGKKIAFYSESNRNPEVHVIDVDGNNESGLSLNPHWDGDPSWSPDGKRIAFASKRDGKTGIYVMAPSGRSQERVTDSSNRDSSPCWSPDGEKIAFVSRRHGNREIYVMNSDGTEQKRLTNNSAFDSNPSWSPDGKKIAFCSNREGNNEIYVMDSDGSNPLNVTNNPADDFAPSWSPLPIDNKTNLSISGQLSS